MLKIILNLSELLPLEISDFTEGGFTYTEGGFTYTKGGFTYTKGGFTYTNLTSSHNYAYYKYP